MPTMPDEWVEKFIRTVRQMRYYQKQYYRNKGASDMISAKRLEAEVDKMISARYQNKLPGMDS